MIIRSCLAQYEAEHDTQELGLALLEKRWFGQQMKIPVTVKRLGKGMEPQKKNFQFAELARRIPTHR
jgi:hypothetical protein